MEMVERNWNGRRRGRRSTQAGMMCDGLSRDRDGRAIFTGRGRVGTGARHITIHDSSPRSSEVTRYTTPARRRQEDEAIAWRIPPWSM